MNSTESKGPLSVIMHTLQLVYGNIVFYLLFILYLFLHFLYFFSLVGCPGP